MKVRAKLYEAEAVQFNGQPMALMDRDGKTIKVFHTMRGHFIRHLSDEMVKIELGSWIITEPEFRILSNDAFEAQFEKIEEEQGNGEKGIEKGS